MYIERSPPPTTPTPTPPTTNAGSNPRYNGLVSTGTIEESLDDWAPIGASLREVGAPLRDGSAYVERDSSTAVSGRYSVRLTCPATAVTFAAWVRRTPFDAIKYPVLAFDYKVSPQVRLN